MNSKDKENLSYLYETVQYKSLVRLCESVRKGIADQMLEFDMTSPNAERHIAFLQGQAFALRSFLKKMEQIHKVAAKD